MNMNSSHPDFRKPWRTCDEPECSEPHFALSMCRHHYNVSRRRRKSLEERFWLRVEKTDDCWVWQGAMDRRGGYGLFYTSGNRLTRAHRFSFELHFRPLAPGEVVDHLCHNEAPMCHGGPSCPHRRCVNPAHLEAVTHAVNVMRGWDRRATCRNGHPRTPENTRVMANGSRRCMTCAWTSAAKYRRQRREADRELVPHGTISGYNTWACRCDACREVGRVNYQIQKARYAARKVAS